VLSFKELPIELDCFGLTIEFTETVGFEFCVLSSSTNDLSDHL